MAQTTISAVLMAAALVLLSLPLSSGQGDRPPIGQPNCNTSCGIWDVPYPFGMGPPRCYLPGYNLTCDTSRDGEPRLLLGDGTFEVQEFEYFGSFGPTLTTQLLAIRTSDTKIDGNGNVRLGGGLRDDGPFALAPLNNELIVIGCNVQATLKKGNVTMGGCFSYCRNVDSAYEYIFDIDFGATGYCKVVIDPEQELAGKPVYITSYDMQLNWFGQNRSTDKQWPTHVFIAEGSWFEQGQISRDLLRRNGSPSKDTMAVPIVLSWEVIGHPMPADHGNTINCTRGERGYMCICNEGYRGNPYITNGCKDIDECEDPISHGCLSECINTAGSFECRPCPQGEHEDYQHNSCTNSVTAACITSCGNVSVPFPFGVGPPHCYLPSFNLTCNSGSLMLGSLRVIDISLPNNMVHVITLGAYFGGGQDGPVYFFSGGFIYEYGWGRGPYSLSSRNELVVVGCDVQGMLVGNSGPSKIISGCASSCSFNNTFSVGRIPSSSKYCYGTGCCQTRIPNNATPLDTWLKWLNPEQTPQGTNNPYTMLIAEEGWWEMFDLGKLMRQSDDDDIFNIPIVNIPIVLLWEPPNCSRDVCKSKNSYCKQGDNGGYSCQCNEGYPGNPYIADGCEGSGGRKFFRGLSILLGVSSAASLICLVVGMRYLNYRLKYLRAKMLKRKHFEQNRGQLLQQLVSQRTDIAERMIIPLEELEKATNNFDKNRELGGGGHGIVYKGILSDLHVVAIKKPKMEVKKEIDEFINEVAILSQINHRNVVKLYGCCLETEVPMLVYEFISNGTLYDHLHIEGPKSLSWGNRLRIAIETAKSLAYLHSTVSIPIIHRDIKSANILLDGTLIAKVADFGASRYVPGDKSGVTTMVQGTIGYLDPMYFYSWRLTEKSDVYSFGVVLVELLTKQKPFSYMSSEGDGLVAHFASLFAEGNLLQILDPQVREEGGKEIEDVAILAVACIKLRGEDRPTMRQVEVKLEGLRASNEYVLDNAMVQELSTDRRNNEESTRQYSMEEEFALSARYPR